MLDYLIDIDKTALLAINGMNTVFQDSFWWLLSAKWSSALIVLMLLWILLHKNRRQLVLVLAMLVLAVVLADQLSSSLIKALVERFRPTHEPSLESMVHVVNDYRGGLFGFVSSHAANSFAAVTLISLIFRNRWTTLALFTWAILQCYSRVYLGVHYPGDILGGMVVGVLVGWLVYKLMRWLEFRLRQRSLTYTQGDCYAMALSVVVTVVVLLVAAAIQTFA